MHSGIIAVFYFILTTVYQKYIIKKEKASKLVAGETCVVFISGVLGMYSIEYLDKGLLKKSQPGAFIGKPEF